MADYRDWIGSRETREDVVTLAPIKGLLATLDDQETVLREGDPLPPLWHWLYFLPQAPQSEIGPDGHGRRGGFLPPIPLPRRMFAGTSLEFPSPLPIGAVVRREGEVTDVQEKAGKTGRLVFVTVRYRVMHGDRLCVEEQQNIVYREQGAPTLAPVPLPALPPAPAGAWTRTITPDPVLLFRFSALTFNGHRIHYDRPYTMGEEGYPGLVVHGPLIALLLLELARRNAGRAIAGYRFRAMAPIFDTAPFRLVGRPGEAEVALEAQRADGETAMTATARLAD